MLGGCDDQEEGTEVFPFSGPFSADAPVIGVESRGSLAQGPEQDSVTSEVDVLSPLLLGRET